MDDGEYTDEEAKKRERLGASSSEDEM